MELSVHVQKDAVANVLCLRTSATECKPLVLSRPRCRTLKSKHLLLLSEAKSGCIVFAVEVYVYLLFYTDCLERHIFVSKADTTGLGEVRISIAGVVEEYLRHLVKIPVESYIDGAKWRSDLIAVLKGEEVKKTAFEQFSDTEMGSERGSSQPELSEFDIVNTLNELSNKLKLDPTFLRSILFYLKQKGHSDTGGQPLVTIPEKALTKVCLFTRSADSYIFPYSQKNSNKHIADGNALFKWWIRVLSRSLDDSWKCKADIPGSDSQAVKRFLPENANWSIGNLYVDENPDDKAVYAIPLFPDDPKGRFLEHLIVENRYKSSSTRQFWNELGFRQEFRLGNVVGIISCSEKEPKVIGMQMGENDVCISTRCYKKIVETIKGEDFRKKEEIETLINSTIPRILEEAGVEVPFTTYIGSKVFSGATSEVTSASAPVNILGVKRPKAVPVNNLTGLVKRKK